MTIYIINNSRKKSNAVLFKVRKNSINRISIIIVHHPLLFYIFFFFFLSITIVLILLLLLHSFFFLELLLLPILLSLFLFTTYAHHANKSEVHPVFLQWYIVAPELDIACSGISQHIFYVINIPPKKFCILSKY